MRSLRRIPKVCSSLKDLFVPKTPMTIGILAVAQPTTSTPTEFLPKHLAARLYRRGWLDKISKALYRRRATRDLQRAMGEIHVGTWYIPDKLPPLEVPNCIFREPESPTWRLQHRAGAP